MSAKPSKRPSKMSAVRSQAPPYVVTLDGCIPRSGRCLGATPCLDGSTAGQLHPLNSWLTADSSLPSPPPLPPPLRGSRGQRHTWIPFFDDANAIIFLAPISAFDQYLEEDYKVRELVLFYHSPTPILDFRTLSATHVAATVPTSRAERLATYRLGIQFSEWGDTNVKP